MKTGDLITSYLNNEMNPEQEREFLLSVAASDSLRLALKSHVMLDRIVTRQAQQVHVPDTIRENIFAQMSASVAGNPHGASAGRAVSHSVTGEGARSAGVFGRSLWKFGRGAMIMMMTACGFAAGYYVHSQSPTGTGQAQTGSLTTPSGSPQAPGQVVTAPQPPSSNATTGADPTAAASQPAEGAEPSLAAPRAGRGGTSPVASSRAVRAAGVSRTLGSGALRRAGTVTDQTPPSTAPMSEPARKPDAPAAQPTPLDPMSTSKPTVTSGAPSSQEPPANTVTLDGTIKDSRGRQQHTLPPEGP